MSDFQPEVRRRELCVEGEQSGTMPSLFDADQLTVRAVADSALARTRDYDLLGPTGDVVGAATQDAGSVGAGVRRRIASSRAAMPVDYELREGSGALLARISKRETGGLRRRLRTEVHLADDLLIAVVTSSVGGAAFTVSQPSGAPIAELARDGRTLFGIAGPHGERYGTVDLEANTLSARRAGTAHPNSYLVRFETNAPLAVRIATVAVAVIADSLRGG
jgi:hypothetical protein